MFLPSFFLPVFLPSLHTSFLCSFFFLPSFISSFLPSFILLTQPRSSTLSCIILMPGMSAHTNCDYWQCRGLGVKENFWEFESINIVGSCFFLESLLSIKYLDYAGELALFMILLSGSSHVLLCCGTPPLLAYSLPFFKTFNWPKHQFGWLNSWSVIEGHWCSL